MNTPPPAPFVPVVLYGFTCTACAGSAYVLKEPRGAVMHEEPMCATFKRLNPTEYLAKMAATMAREGVPTIG